MNHAINTLLQRLSSKDRLEQYQAFARSIRAMSKPPRSTTFKPRANHGFRGMPRILKDHFMPAPTIDEVRRLEKQFNVKLHVKYGLLYLRDGTPFDQKMFLKEA